MNEALLRNMDDTELLLYAETHYHPMVIKELETRLRNNVGDWIEVEQEDKEFHTQLRKIRSEFEDARELLSEIHDLIDGKLSALGDSLQEAEGKLEDLQTEHEPVE